MKLTTKIEATTTTIKYEMKNFFKCKKIAFIVRIQSTINKSKCKKKIAKIKSNVKSHRHHW